MKRPMNDSNCDRLLSIYSRKANGDLSTLPIQVRCSNPGYHISVFYKDIDTTESSFAVFLCKQHSDENAWTEREPSPALTVAEITEESDRYLILAGDVDPDDYWDNSQWGIVDEPDTTQENMERYGLV